MFVFCFYGIFECLKLYNYSYLFIIYILWEIVILWKEFWLIYFFVYFSWGGIFVVNIGVEIVGIFGGFVFGNEICDDFLSFIEFVEVVSKGSCFFVVF